MTPRMKNLKKTGGVVDHNEMNGSKGLIQPGSLHQEETHRQDTPVLKLILVHSPPIT